MKQLVVISGKGGTGKTSITAALAGFGPKKVLADCDVDAADLHLVLHPKKLESIDFYSGQLATIDPDLCIQCGICADHCRFDAISRDFSIIKEHCEGCGVCEFVCPQGAAIMEERMCGYQYVSETRFGTMVHAELGIGEENSGKLVTSVRKRAKEIAEEQGAEMVIVDGSPGVGCPVIASLSDVDACLLVAEPTVSAVHDVKRVHELTTHFKIPCVAVINKCGVNPDLENELREFCKESNVPVLGSLAYDTAFTEAQIHGQTVAEYAPDGLGKDIAGMWGRLAQYLEISGE
ncbi:4Fe-4S binding protein [Pseudodesulfovibrio senegalensis]|jgi:MinD superfamily P-loop ATPase|uniref:(4Fe-4S)-binding protein n=1 Tax=Pseudodesulfovibrio senegalensis TaxID=1721087 RepID=A0A6N6N7N5_9BACT|nr:ATP-binding protein [Pseudodesulfovibrio senegalensis]KAB1443688.1 (4Fe-4S)-binding protein [Pseudodesulfovibrio senegalensis]